MPLTAVDRLMADLTPAVERDKQGQTYAAIYFEGARKIVALWLPDIEAEATARALEAAKERVRALPVNPFQMGGDWISRAAVLAALDEPVEAGNE